MIHFRKVEAKEQRARELSELHRNLLTSFGKYAQYETELAGNSTKISGKTSSYTRYLIKMLIIAEENNLVQPSVTNIEKIYKVLKNLQQDTNFSMYNLGEKRFPNATIKCFSRYIQSDNISEVLSEKDFKEQEYADYIMNKNTNTIYERPEQYKTEIIGYVRNENFAIQAKKQAHWQCEVDVNHESFISKNTSKNYTEAHHLIPMAAQKFFEHSIDIPCNIVSLCPNCHRKIHLAQDIEKQKLLSLLYNKRIGLLNKAHIHISIEQLYSFYK